MALTGALGAFIGASLTKNIPINFFLILVCLIISYESFILLKDDINSTRKNKISKQNNNDKKVIENMLI